MAEYEPTTAGGNTSLLLEVLAQTFKGDVPGSLDEFEVKIRRYERTCGEVLSDRVKIAVVQKGIEKMTSDATCSCVPSACQRILLCERRSEASSWPVTLTGPAPMDVSAVCEGKGKNKCKGKHMEKDKEKDPATNPDAEMICFCCHRKGHRK